MAKDSKKELSKGLAKKLARKVLLLPSKDIIDGKQIFIDALCDGFALKQTLATDKGDMPLFSTKLALQSYLKDKKKDITALKVLSGLRSGGTSTVQFAGGGLVSGLGLAAAIAGLVGAVPTGGGSLFVSALGFSTAMAGGGLSAFGGASLLGKAGLSGIKKSTQIYTKGKDHNKERLSNNAVRNTNLYLLNLHTTKVAYLLAEAFEYQIACLSSPEDIKKLAYGAVERAWVSFGVAVKQKATKDKKKPDELIDIPITAGSIIKGILGLGIKAKNKSRVTTREKGLSWSVDKVFTKTGVVDRRYKVDGKTAVGGDKLTLEKTYYLAEGQRPGKYGYRASLFNIPDKDIKDSIPGVSDMKTGAAEGYHADYSPHGVEVPDNFVHSFLSHANDKKGYSHNLMQLKSAPDSDKLSRGFYLYREGGSGTVSVKVIHSKGNEETFCLTTLLKAEKQPNLLDNISWPKEGDKAVPLEKALVDIIADSFKLNHTQNINDYLKQALGPKAGKKQVQVIFRGNLSASKISKNHFKKLDGYNFDGSNFSYSVLNDGKEKCSAKKASFNRCLLLGAVLKKADLTGSSFKKSLLVLSNFSESLFNKTDFSGSVLLESDMSNSAVYYNTLVENCAIQRVVSLNSTYYQDALDKQGIKGGFEQLTQINKLLHLFAVTKETAEKYEGLSKLLNEFQLSQTKSNRSFGEGIQLLEKMLVVFHRDSAEGFELFKRQTGIFALEITSKVHKNADELNTLKKKVKKTSDAINKLTEKKVKLKQSGPITWQLPCKNDDFVGRKKQLDGIKKSLQQDQKSLTIQVVSGLGGVGKTELALAYAHQVKKAYQAILWFNAEVELHLEYVNFAQDKENGLG